MDPPMNRVEQDREQPSAGNELPTYDDLAQQNGPNSRFGRWKGWIEKRAAERYNDVTPEERQRRRERGWELDPKPAIPNSSLRRASNVNYYPTIAKEPPTSRPLPNLEVQTSHLNLNDDPFVDQPPTSISPQPSAFASKRIEPSHLRLSHFGSRFLPHSTSQIRCVLPLHSERLLLIGHDEGLSVLEFFPQEWSEAGGIDVKSPDEAHTRLIWEGEGVFQMSILEQGENLEGTTQGVVLFLVGSESGSPGASDSPRSLRMYNLLSLSKLAKWTVAHKDACPLDLRRPPDWQVQTSPVKKHRQHSSIARGLKSLIDAPSTADTQRPISYQNMLNPGCSANTALGSHPNVPSHDSDFPKKLSPSRRKTSTTNLSSAGWDVVDETPLRWATDFVPLATANSRLANSVVTSFALWADENRIGRGGQLLAVASKSNILLYEVPKGERLFRFVKEFYTPLQPRSVTFFHQIVHEVTRSVSEMTGSSNNGYKHKRSDSSATVRSPGDGHGSQGAGSSFIDYGTQLSLFVIFDKKAGWIRIADSAVGEMELPDDSFISALNQDQGSSFLSPRDTIGLGSHGIRSRLSFEYVSPPKWIPLAQCELPVLKSGTGSNEVETTRKVLFLTRGRKTHILPSPLPTNYAAYPSLAIIAWKSPPRNIIPRLCDENGLRFLQLVAFGEDGVEVQEMSLNFISRGKGKGKAKVEEVVRAEDDVIGDCGFLSFGGHWDQLSRWMDPTRMTRSKSTSSDASTASYDSTATSIIVSQMKREEGMYAWWRKGVGDYRVFWVGGSADHDAPFSKG